MAPSTADTKPLNDRLASTLALLAQLASSLHPNSPITTTSTATSTTPTPNPLRLLSDAAALIKAHTTKITLLTTTAPFTPSALATVLAELLAKPLPALATAVQQLEAAPAEWTSFLARDARARVRRLATELQRLLGEVQTRVAPSSPGRTTTPATATVRDERLRSTTGVVWAASDAVVELAGLGIVGLAVATAQQQRETIADALAELRAWREGADRDAEGRGDGLLDSDDEGVDGDRESIEDLFHAAHSLPADRPELEALVVRAEGAMKKLTLLYAALGKRRLAGFPVTAGAAAETDTRPQAVARLDQLMVRLRRMPHLLDELASCFYDLDEGRARAMLERCVAEGVGASEVAERNWDGQEDGYSEWFRKWRAAVRADVPSKTT